MLVFLANSAIHQSLSTLLIISIAETPVIGSGLNMQGTVQVKTKNIYDLTGHRIKLNIDMQITNRKVLSAGQTISKETVPRHTSFPPLFFFLMYIKKNHNFSWGPHIIKIQFD